MVDIFLNSVGSLCLGYTFGLGTAYIFKNIDMRHHRLAEISVFLVLSYVPFLLAEILHLSGIVTILFTGKYSSRRCILSYLGTTLINSIVTIGVAANRYVVPNLSPITRANSDMLVSVQLHLVSSGVP